MDTEWDAFLAEHGDDITTSVRESFTLNTHLFDINDSTHAAISCGHIAPHNAKTQMTSHIVVSAS
jgi:hypothetical protein